jgi:hypothetical protein
LNILVCRTFQLLLLSRYYFTSHIFLHPKKIQLMIFKILLLLIIWALILAYRSYCPWWKILCTALVRLWYDWRYFYCFLHAREIGAYNCCIYILSGCPPPPTKKVNECKLDRNYIQNSMFYWYIKSIVSIRNNVKSQQCLKHIPEWSYCPNRLTYSCGVVGDAIFVSHKIILI